MTNENAFQTTANNASTPENPQVTGKIQRKTACIISWIAVIAMLALIFFMSSRSGIDIDNNTASSPRSSGGCPRKLPPCPGTKWM